MIDIFVTIADFLHICQKIKDFALKRLAFFLKLV